MILLLTCYILRFKYTKIGMVPRLFKLLILFTILLYFSDGNHLHGIVSNSIAVTEDYVACDNGKHIPKYAQCNGIVDCDDVSDESHCHSKGEGD